MHILEAYSTSSGLKIDKPFILDRFFAVPAEKYITLHTGDGKFGSRTYDYWQDVADFLNKFLSPHGISIVQIGANEDKKLQNIICLNGKTSISQTAYILKNSLCHVGIDSLPIHLASHYEKKIVGLYSNAPAQNSAPYWSKSSDVILLESDKDGDKPTYAKEETPKTINTIFPDVITASACKLLGIKFDYDYRTIYLGKQYKQTVIEYIPDTLTDLPEINPLVIRMDLHFSEENLLPVFNKNKCIIVTDKPINISLIRANKEKIIKIICRVKDNTMVDFIKTLTQIPIDIEALSRLEGEELNDLKFDYLDTVAIINSENILKKEDIKQLSGVDINKLFYLPNKFTLSKDKIYDSEYAWRTNKPIEKLTKKLTKLDLNKDKEELFWEEADFFCFLTPKKLDPSPKK